jgi:hypothetical protein
MSTTTPARTVAGDISILESLSDPARRIVVEAWDIHQPATEHCWFSTSHGAGTCYVDRWASTPMCLDCCIRVIEAQSQAGKHWTVDVAS